MWKRPAKRRRIPPSRTAGIITELLRPDPKALSLSPEQPKKPEVADAIDSALDSSSTQVPFDDLTERYKGKTVWVIDRDKIRNRVAQVVDQALFMSQQNAEGMAETRERVALAIQGMFGDNRNIASEAPRSTAAMEQQIARMASLITKAEGALAAISAAARNASYGRRCPPAGWSTPGRHTPRCRTPCSWRSLKRTSNCCAPWRPRLHPTARPSSRLSREQ